MQQSPGVRRYWRLTSCAAWSNVTPRRLQHRQMKSGLSVLTSREVEVLRLIGRGESNTEMSRALWVAETTVKTHVTRIFRKLDIRDRAQAVVAYETGVVKRGDAG